MRLALGAIVLGLLLVSCRQEASVATAPGVNVAQANAITAPPPAAGNGAATANFPALTGRVVDNAELLTPEQEAELAARSEALERRTTDQFVIATVPSLGGQAIAEYARSLGNHWRIGQRGRNNGVLMVVAPAERQVWIAVGNGLLTALPNEETQQIVDTELIPAFRESRFAEGIARASRRITSRLEADVPQGGEGR